MRVLWFTNTPSNYMIAKGGYNGGGWISSLEKEIRNLKNVELAVAFILPNHPFKKRINEVTYYPIDLNNNIKLAKIKKAIMGYCNINRQYEIDKYTQVINDFKPDIIEIFGSEQSFGLISSFTKIPIVLHIQGIINPYYNAFLPPSISWKRVFFNNRNLVTGFKAWINRRYWLYLCEQEKEILKNVQYYIGRTIWDKRVVNIFNNNCIYFYGSEILRETFYEVSYRKIPNSLEIVTTISSPLYKGMDLVLKTAKLLKENLNMDFNWEVYGNIDPCFIEKSFGFSCSDVNVKLMGVAQADEIKNALLKSTCFFHPSYIDNSPNSICEAQMLGCSVISTNVGGISSLITDNETGFLVPANDPYQAAYLINQLYLDIGLNIRIGDNASKIASQRHHKEKITHSLMEIYKQIINESI